MERYIAHALTLESEETSRITGKPNRRKDTPRPKSKASPTAKKMKNGSCPAVGSTPTSAGGKSTGPKKKAGIPTAAVTNATFARVFTISPPSFCGVLWSHRRHGRSPPSGRLAGGKPPAALRREAGRRALAGLLALLRAAARGGRGRPRAGQHRGRHQRRRHQRRGQDRS